MELFSVPVGYFLGVVLPIGLWGEVFAVIDELKVGDECCLVGVGFGHCAVDLRCSMLPGCSLANRLRVDLASVVGEGRVPV